MTELLHQRLRENAQKLLDNKGDISCPAAYLNKEPKTTILLPACNEWTITCLHICGSIFPKWRKVAKFSDSGVKSTISKCPCSSPLTLIINVKDVFWAYIDEVLERKLKQEQDMSPNW